MPKRNEIWMKGKGPQFLRDQRNLAKQHEREERAKILAAFEEHFESKWSQHGDLAGIEIENAKRLFYFLFMAGFHAGQERDREARVKAAVAQIDREFAA